MNLNIVINKEGEQVQEQGLSYEPWDDHDWSLCSKCQKWYKNELTEGSCINCANLPEPII